MPLPAVRTAVLAAAVAFGGPAAALAGPEGVLDAPPIRPPEPYGLLDPIARIPFLDFAPPLDAPDDHVVVLVHGLDEVGAIFGELAPALLDAGAEPAIFVYPNDAGIDANAASLRAALAALHDAGVEEVTLVGHSMGGLVAYDALTRPADRPGDGLPRVRRLITLGTPYDGAILAYLQPISDLREHALRWWDSDDLNPRLLLGFLDDGDGQAGADLLPGSPRLEALASRPWPAGVPLTVVYGQLLEPGEPPAPSAEPEGGADWARWTPGWARSAVRWASGLWRDAGFTLASWTWRLSAWAGEIVGDGIVSATSARAVWIARETPDAGSGVEIVPIRASHSSMLWADGIDRLAPGTRIVLDRVAADGE